MAYSVEFRELMPEKRELKTNASFALNFPLKEFRITVFDPDGRKRVLSYSNDVATELVMPGNFATVQKASGDMGFPDVMAPWIDFHNGLTLQLSDELLKKAEIKESPNSIIIEEMEDSAKRFVFDAKTGFLLKVEFIAEYGGKSRVSMDYSLGNYGTFGTFRFPLEITQGFYNESGELTHHRGAANLKFTVFAASHFTACDRCADGGRMIAMVLIDRDHRTVFR